MWFSPTLGFHVNIGVLVHCVDVFVIVYYALMNVNAYDTVRY
jgi:hypothetical protein